MRPDYIWKTLSQITLLHFSTRLNRFPEPQFEHQASIWSKTEQRQRRFWWLIWISGLFYFYVYKIWTEDVKDWQQKKSSETKEASLDALNLKLFHTWENKSAASSSSVCFSPTLFKQL